MRKNKVYVPQRPSKFDAATRLWVPQLDLTPAERFGEVVIMLPPNANRLHVGQLIPVLKDQMRDYREGDYLVAVGDPSLIAVSAVIAYRKSNGGMLRILKWDRMIADYLVSEFKT